MLFFSAAAAVVAGYCCLLIFLSKSQSPDVVLITIDALRADHLGCYGYKRDTSPNIDALARGGALFTQAIAQASRTQASVGVIATSTYPPTNRLHEWGDSLNPAIPTLMEILKDRDYKTIFAGSNANFHKGLRGFGGSFDEFYDERVPAPVLTQKALELVGEVHSKPFFLWVHYMDVHEYAPAKEFKSLYVNDEFYDKKKKLPIVKSVASPHGYRGIRYGYRGISDSIAKRGGGIDNPDYYIALYDGAIRSVDQQIGFLLRSLALATKNRKTLVIVTADHGELLGEHGYYFSHGGFLYEPLIKVPFILRYPNKVPSGRIDAQIRAGLDVLPTILGALKIKGPATAQGVDLVRALKEGGAGSFPVVSEDSRRISVRTDRWKLLLFSGENALSDTYELFNLKSDPGETVNLASVERREFAALKEKMDEYRKSFPRASAVPPTLDEETRRDLRALGYLQ